MSVIPGGSSLPLLTTVMLTRSWRTGSIAPISCLSARHAGQLSDT
ncbi:hypothetical protein ACIHCQ_16870 [Streptomyces sp. NPDC052236]